MVLKEPKRAGRPPKFARDETASQIQRVFWRQGYAGASLDDLTSATGLHKPSLYAAFGDKRAMYLGALDDYLERSGESVRAEMALPTLRESLTAFYNRALDVYLRHDDARGCFLLATAVPMALSDDEVRERVRQAMKGLDRAMLRRVERAGEEGELAPGSDPLLLSDILMGAHFSMAAHARAGTDGSLLRQRIARIVDFACG